MPFLRVERRRTKGDDGDARDAPSPPPTPRKKKGVVPLLLPGPKRSAGLTRRERHHRHTLGDPIIAGDVANARLTGI